MWQNSVLFPLTVEFAGTFCIELEGQLLHQKHKPLAFSKFLKTEVRFSVVCSD